jgi:hypothetical protein
LRACRGTALLLIVSIFYGIGRVEPTVPLAWRSSVSTIASARLLRQWWTTSTAIEQGLL